MLGRLSRLAAALVVALAAAPGHAAPRDVTLKLRCGGDKATPYWAMEFTASKGTCWMHGGHHTYFFGDRTYRFVKATGMAFAVEQMFSPPTEVVAASPGTTPVWLESSLDGRTWTEVGYAPYRLLTSRQEVKFEIGDADGPVFRFLRVRAPRSAAQGLSGYVDHTSLDVVATPLGPAPKPRPAARTVDLTCEDDILEDFFAEHPCWFGGINRYDAPSFFHTYFLGDGARLTKVTGRLRLGPWRTDDTPATERCKAYIQVSVDGVRWTNVATVDGPFGEERTFSVALKNVRARFVRLFPDYHPRYDDTRTAAPLHHPKGFFLGSAVTVTGSLGG